MRDVASLRPVTLALVAAELLVGIAVGPFGGIVVGLCAAAAFVGTHLGFGVWRTHSAPLLVATVAALLAHGWLSGLAGSRLRRGADHNTRPLTTRHPGLLPREDGLVYLAAEFARATEYGRPLALLVLNLSHAESAPDDLRCRVAGTITRSVMSELPAIAAPFAISESEVGIVLPEHTLAAARSIADRLVTGVRAASFTDPRTGDRRAVADAVDLSVGVSRLEASAADASALLKSARADVLRAAPDIHLAERPVLAGAHR
ncbi:MAG: hypothetical protein WAV45_01415 [Propionibacteriaceae bacterium]